MDIYLQTDCEKERGERALPVLDLMVADFVEACASSMWTCMWWSEDGFRCWSLAPAIFCLQESIPGLEINQVGFLAGP